MHSCKEGKEVSSSYQTCKRLAFPFLAFCILHLFRCRFYLPLLPHNEGFRVWQVPSVLCWYLLDGVQSAHLQLVLSVSTRPHLPQVRLHFSPASECCIRHWGLEGCARSCHSKCLCEVTPGVSMLALRQLWQSDAFSGYFTFSSINWFHLAIPVHSIF